MIPASRSGGMYARSAPVGSVGEVRRVEGELLPAREEVARPASRSESPQAGSRNSADSVRAREPNAADTVSRDSLALTVSASDESSDDLPPAVRRAMSTYVENENLTRFDANADFLGRVDAWA